MSCGCSRMNQSASPPLLVPFECANERAHHVLSEGKSESVGLSHGAEGHNVVAVVPRGVRVLQRVTAIAIIALALSVVVSTFAGTYYGWPPRSHTDTGRK